MRKFAITDIHGCIQSFKTLVQEGIQLTTEDELYLLGDYIDRGPDSKGVIDFIFQLQEEGHFVRCLRGNHEQLLLDSMKAGTPKQEIHLWLTQGGKETLDSFNAELADQIDPKYLDFFNGLEYYFEVDQFLLVHAGFNFRSNQPFQDKHAMLWIRRFPIDEQLLGDRIIVHGHTPTQWPMIEATVKSPYSKVIDIDNGCVYHYKGQGLGGLLAYDLTNREVYRQEYIG